MSLLSFTLRNAPPARLDLSGLTPAKLAGVSTYDVARIVVGKDRDQATIGDVFDVSGALDGNTGLMVFAGCNGLMDGVGDGLDGGHIIVEGDVGAHAGRDMKKGRLDIRGSTGAYLGAGMKGGLITVAKNAGEFVGGALTGDKNGMAGGTIVIDGDVGERAGDRMRRGTIIARGSFGAQAGSRMLGGTLWSEKGFGLNPGSLLRRGTLIAPKFDAIPATFADCGRHDLTILRIMSRYMIETLGTLAPKPLPPMVRRYAGDLSTAGKGEIWVTG
jgi:formylmethanofuran dehydrogenase subunit C